MQWYKININDVNTFPTIGKKVMWCRTGRDNFMVYSALQKDSDGEYYTDGRYITDDDYWFDIPKLTI